MGSAAERNSGRAGRRAGSGAAASSAGKVMVGGRVLEVVRGKRPIVLFVVMFAVLTVAILGVLSAPVFAKGVYPEYLALTAEASAWLLRRLGESALAHETIVETPRYVLSIARGCDAT